MLLVKFLEMGGRPVTLLDGDIVRRHLSSELGFSKEHRDINVRRIGFVASEITKNGGIAICAPIAPYAAVRKLNRELVESTGGGYILVHISTPVEVCEQRDRKGLYAKARAGVIQQFTGISDPYEVPEDAEVRIDNGAITVPAFERRSALQATADENQASCAGWLPNVAKTPGGLKASWITTSAFLACSINHLFGEVSPPKMTLSPAYSTMKLTGPSPV